ncbi:hypothetical protein OY671_008440, partial [Metschnikowia pulcherrima]
MSSAASSAFITGAISSRTRGVYFIMITSAFAQMAYYIASGMSRYGGDDGSTIYKRSTFGGSIDMSNRTQFYYLCSGCSFGGIYSIWRIINSRFGMVVQGIRSNEQRMQAIGYHANRYRSVCFVISGTICGSAGASSTTFFYVFPSVGTVFGSSAFVAVCMGGFGSSPGAFIAGISIGIIEAMTGYFVAPASKTVSVFILFISKKDGAASGVSKWPVAVASAAAVSSASVPSVVTDSFTSQVS